MKRFLLLLLPLLCCGGFLLSACGDDNDDIDRNFTNVSYQLQPTYDLQKFYKVMAYYTDFDGISHEELIENTTEWNYREIRSGNYNIKCRVVAIAKEPAEYGDLEKDYYDLGYSYAIHWYKQEGGAHSKQPTPVSISVAKDEMAKYLNDHPTITVFDFSV